MAAILRRLDNEHVRAIFECLHDGKPPPPGLPFQIVHVGSKGLKLSPPSFEFEDGLYVLLKPIRKSSRKKNFEPPKVPEHLTHLVMEELPPETCPWSLSGPQFPPPTAIQQRYCYPKGTPEYSGRKGGALWTMYRKDGTEDLEFRLLHVYYSAKRAFNRGMADDAPIMDASRPQLMPPPVLSRSKSLTTTTATSNAVASTLRPPTRMESTSNLHSFCTSPVRFDGDLAGPSPSRSVQPMSAPPSFFISPHPESFLAPPAFCSFPDPALLTPSPFRDATGNKENDGMPPMSDIDTTPEAHTASNLPPSCTKDDTFSCDLSSGFCSLPDDPFLGGMMMSSTMDTGMAMTMMGSENDPVAMSHSFPFPPLLPPPPPPAQESELRLAARLEAIHKTIVHDLILPITTPEEQAALTRVLKEWAERVARDPLLQHSSRDTTNQNHHTSRGYGEASDERDLVYEASNMCSV